MAKLTVATLKKEVKVYDQKEVITVFGTDGESFEVTIKPLFRPSEIDSLMQEITRDLITIHEENPTALKWGDLLLQGYIILKFSDVAERKTPYSLKSKLEIIAMLIDTRLMVQIIDAFPLTSVTEVAETINKAIVLNYESLAADETIPKEERDFAISFLQTAEEFDKD